MDASRNQQLVGLYLCLSSSCLSRCLHDAREQGVGVRHQNLWGVELGGGPLVHDQNVVALLQDLVAEAVHDGKDGGSRAVNSHGLLQEGIGTGVNGGSGLIQQQDLGVAEDSAGQAQELTLADGVVGAVVSDGGIELVLLVGDEVLETNQLESVPKGCIVVATLEVQSGADGSGENERIYSGRLVTIRNGRRGIEIPWGINSIPRRRV